MGQIILNLAVNARDAMPHGGTFRVETSNLHLKGTCDMVPDMPPGDYVQFTVIDTGSGMDQATQNHIFEPFFTTKEMGKGTGLGLATIYGIINQSRGYISVFSEPGCGTAFTIYFPRLLETTAPVARVAVPQAPVAASGTILLVEDDECVRETTSEMLQSLGYRVIEKPGPQEAIAFCEAGSEAVDLILADVVMPGMSGMEMMKRISAMTTALPILYMSGHSSDMINAQGGLDEGIQFVRKPFAMDTLHTKVLSAIQAGAFGKGTI